MSVGIFLNFIGGYPVAELHASQKQNLKDEKDTIKIYMLGKSIKATNYNPFGRKLVKQYEHVRAKSVAEFLNLETIYIESKFSNEEIKKKINKKTLKKLEFGVLSTLSAYTRVDNINKLTKTWLKSYNHLVNTAGNIYLFFQNEKKNKLNKIYMFNGRFIEDNAARVFAIDENIKYKVYDFKSSNTYYEFENCSLHSVDENCKRALEFYKKDYKKAFKVASDFILAKKNGIATYEKSYTTNQKSGFRNYKKNKKNELISIFPSSDDEYKFLGTDWGAPIVASQVNEIREMIKMLPFSEFQFVIRMHPNMIDLDKKIIKAYSMLEKQFKNCSVILPLDKSSTYDLIDDSDYVVCFCSTVGVEASYLRKKTIGIGGSPYYNLNILNKALNGKEAGNLIQNNNLFIKDIKESVIWMNYLWRYTQENPYIKLGRENKKQLFSFKLKSTYIERLLQSPFRLEIEFKKPKPFNFSVFKRWLNSIFNILFNNFSDK